MPPWSISRWKLPSSSPAPHSRACLRGTVHATKRSILDTLGVTIQGSNEPAARLVQKLATPTSSPTGARVLGTSLRCSPQEAALANGVAAHVLEYDDTQVSPSPDVVYGLLMHPTAPILSGALALVQQHDVSGRQLITAVAVGVGGGMQAGGSRRRPPLFARVALHWDRRIHRELCGCRADS